MRELGGMSTREPIVLVELVQTCEACPSQWEGVTDTGLHFYARYRHGRLGWGVGETITDAVHDAFEDRVEVPREADGWMDTEEMVKLAGVVRGAFRPGYTDGWWTVRVAGGPAFMANAVVALAAAAREREPGPTREVYERLMRACVEASPE
jgi:hypothetical protein